MPRSDVEDLAHMVREVLALAGLHDRTHDQGPGGFEVWTLDDRVTVDWIPAEAWFDEAQRLYRHRSHPLPVLEEELRAVMERAVASVLYAAGFTVTLQPTLRDASRHEESSARVIVTAAPRIKAWATD